MQINSIRSLHRKRLVVVSINKVIVRIFKQQQSGCWFGYEGLFQNVVTLKTNDHKWLLSNFNLKWWLIQLRRFLKISNTFFYSWSRPDETQKKWTIARSCSLCLGIKKTVVSSFIYIFNFHWELYIVKCFWVLFSITHFCERNATNWMQNFVLKTNEHFSKTHEINLLFELIAKHRFHFLVLVNYWNYPACVTGAVYISFI